MEIRFYTANVINSKVQGDVDLQDAPLLEGSGKPKFGLKGYYSAPALSFALRPTIVEAMKSKKVVAFLEVTVSNLNDRLTPEMQKSFSTTNMKPEELPHCDLLHINRISSALRKEIVEILQDGADTAEKRLALSKVTSDRYLIDYIKMHPTAIDQLHENSKFSHLKVIIFPTGNDSRTEYMTNLYQANPENVKIKEVNPIKGVQFQLPAEIAMINNTLSSPAHSPAITMNM